MENNKLIVLNQNSELALLKSRNLLDITKKILNNKELIQFFNFKPLLKEKGHSYYIRSIAISPDGKNIVSGSIDKTIKVWDFKTGECLNTLEGHTSSINSIAISPDGKYIVSGSDDGIIKIWDFKTFKEIYKLDISYKILIDKNGYFNGSDEAIDKYLRVSEEPLTQRKLTSEEIKHFLKKDNFIDIGNV